GRRRELGIASLAGTRAELAGRLRRCVRERQRQGGGGDGDGNFHHVINRKRSQQACKPNSVPPAPAFAPRGAPAGYGETTIPLAPSSLTGSSDRPGGVRRAVFYHTGALSAGLTDALSAGLTDALSAGGCLPIWSCSVRGFACHPCCHGRGA